MENNKLRQLLEEYRDELMKRLCSKALETKEISDKVAEVQHQIDKIDAE